MNIEIAGNITQQDCQKLNELLANPVGARRRIVFGFWILIFISGAILTVVGIWEFLSRTPYFVFIIGLGLFEMMLALRLRSLLGQSWRQADCANETYHGLISDDGIKMKSSFISIDFPWSEVTSYGKHNDRLVALFRGSAVIATLPDKFFGSDEEWLHFLDALQSRIPLSHHLEVRQIHRSKVSLKPLHIVVLVLLILLIATILFTSGQYSNSALSSGALTIRWSGPGMQAG